MWTPIFQFSALVVIIVAGLFVRNNGLQNLSVVDQFRLSQTKFNFFNSNRKTIVYFRKKDESQVNAKFTKRQRL